MHFIRSLRDPTLAILEAPLVYEPGQRRTCTRAGRTGILDRVSLRESAILGAGHGVYLREDVAVESRTDGA